MLINVSAKKVLKEGLHSKTQCQRVTSLYLTESTREYLSPTNFEVVSIFEYFARKNLTHYNKLLKKFNNIIIQEYSSFSHYLWASWEEGNIKTRKAEYSIMKSHCFFRLVISNFKFGNVAA